MSEIMIRIVSPEEKWKAAVLLSGGTFDKIWRYYAKTNDEVTR